MSRQPVVDAGGELALEVRGVAKSFPGVRALSGVDFSLRRGEVHALVGENGAGKSTLMNVLGGVFPPDSGQILLGGRPVRLKNPHDASRQGIGIVHQELSLAPNLSVAENIYANRQPTRAAGLIDWKRLYERTRRMLALFEMKIEPSALVKRLSLAQQQVVEILKALSRDPSVLILDEPTSSLTAVETSLLFRNIRRLRDSGVSVIYISHHMAEIFEICDRVTVFRDGSHVATSRIGETSEAQLVKSMVGRELANMYGVRASEIGEEYFRVEDASRPPAFRGVSFSLRRGEILGFAGLVGAGRTELARALFGAEPLASGRVALEGKTIRLASPAHAIRNRIGYLTEDRKEQGLFLRMSVRDNCVAPNLGAFVAAGGVFLSERAISGFAETMRSKLNIVAPSVRQQVRNLSGGNQQKVLLAEWMGIQPRVLIVDEPTRGVDVGAKSEIYALLRQLAASGVGIIMISSDLLEILGLSDRILVMREGRIAGEFMREQASEENLLACAAGVGLDK